MSSVLAVTVYDFLSYCRTYIFGTKLIIKNNLTKKSHEHNIIMISIKDDISESLFIQKSLPLRKCTKTNNTKEEDKNIDLVCVLELLCLPKH